MNQFNYGQTKELSKKIRIHSINMASKGGSSHIASVFSIADILAVLYENVLNYDPRNPNMSDRDRFILSKGHAGAGVYAVLAEKNFFSVDELTKHYQNGSNFSGHISHKNIPGVEISTGSLGHGLPVSVGISLAAKLNNHNYMIYVILSDGECDEGSNWEAALFAAHHKLDNLVVIIDRNNLQSIKSTEDTLALEPLEDKWASFGWSTKVVDGHNLKELIEVLDKKNVISNKPKCIIANTIKGKGVSFMENNNLWHYRSPKGKEFNDALLELSKS
jgi:transketolase